MAVPLNQRLPGFKLYKILNDELLEFTIGERVLLGQGGEGAVYKTTISRKDVTFVTVIKEHRGANVTEKTLTEFINMNKVKPCPGIMKLNGVALHKNVYDRLKTRHKDLYYHEGDSHVTHSLYELVPGITLQQRVFAQSDEDNYDAKQIFHNIATSLKCIHEHNIVHRDLKPENIMIDELNNTKIVDFGSACDVDKCPPIKSGVTPEYAGVEFGNYQFNKETNRIRTINANKQLHKKFDIFSLGCILYFVLFRSILFPMRPFGSLQWNLTVESLKFPEIEDAEQRKWLDLIVDMINPDVVDRISIEQVLERLDALPNPDLSLFEPLHRTIYGGTRRTRRSSRARSRRALRSRHRSHRNRK